MLITAIFEITWANPKDKEARERTLALFSDCKIKKARKCELFDHTCETQRLQPEREVMDRLDGVLARAGDDVANITVRLRDPARVKPKSRLRTLGLWLIGVSER